MMVEENCSKKCLSVSEGAKAEDNDKRRGAKA